MKRIRPYEVSRKKWILNREYLSSAKKSADPLEMREIEKLEKDTTKYARFIFEDNVSLYLKKMTVRCVIFQTSLSVCPVSTERCVSLSEIELRNWTRRFNSTSPVQSYLAQTRPSTPRASIKDPMENWWKITSRSVRSH